MQFSRAWLWSGAAGVGLLLIAVLAFLADADHGLIALMLVLLAGGQWLLWQRWNSRQAETSGEDGDARFRRVFDVVPAVAVRGHTADGKTIYWNQAAARLYGYTAAEALGRSVLDLVIPAPLQARYAADLQAMRATRRPLAAGEMSLRCKDGSSVDVLTSHAVVEGEDGAPQLFCIDIDLSERKRAVEQIQKLAYYDVLTGLPNRALLIDRASQALSLAKRNASPVALMYLDLDNFKVINDTLGHRVGDLLLAAVAARLLSAVREHDTVSRQGGDEFVIVLPQTAADGAAHVAEKMRLSVAEPLVIEGHELRITTSIGIAMFPDDANDFDILAREADAAMYRAKHQGRNRICFSGRADLLLPAA